MSLSTKAENYLTSEALVVGGCKLAKEMLDLAGVGNGEVVDPDDGEEKLAVALESEDAEFAPKTA
eukprot:6198293-Pleurochrysis_carterae.AAC.3